MIQGQEEHYIWIDENHNDVRYGLKGKILIEEQTPYQEIKIVETKRYGKALLLDRCWMTAEKQEKHYHESLVHPALCSAKQIGKILIIGGGDGGTAKECLKYKEVKKIDMVEIDTRVVELSKIYLKSISEGAWNDKRLNVYIEDGIRWVKNARQNSYDVILVDSSDPAGPAAGLFNKTFYNQCKRILRPGGIFGTQSESPEAFLEVHLEIIKVMREIFTYADPIYGWVPMYPSGWWSWTFAADDGQFYSDPVISRALQMSTQCEIWNLEWQKAAFKLMPAFINRKLKK